MTGSVPRSTVNLHWLTISAAVLLGVGMASPTILPTGMLAGVPGPTQGEFGFPTPWLPAQTHIKHIITVIMENRVYDNYFGQYCRSLGTYCSGVGNGPAKTTCVPYEPTNPLLGCAPPYLFSARNLNTSDLVHDWDSGRLALDNGSDDGIYLAERAGTLPLGEYNGSTIPIYWDLAEQYAISDNFFAANLSYSLPNHWYLVAGQAPTISEQSYLKTAADRTNYLNESNATPTIQDLLNGTSVSWRYYDYTLMPYDSAVNNHTWGSAYDYWNPLAGKAESYAPAFVNHFAPRTQFVTDVLNGSLPQLSWVVPAASESDHPGYNISEGESWVAQLVDTVEGSPYWNSTAIFLTWDDYGGWYDHVAPPVALEDQLSFRAPLIVISPYAKENYISHQFTDFFSLLHYEEWTFGLGCLTSLDCNAPMPWDLFAFNSTARAPLSFATSWLQAHYPAPLQAPGAGPTLCTSCGVISWPSWQGPDVPYTNPAFGD